LIANTKDVATAIEINKLFEVVIAPEYDAEAIEILQEKQNYFNSKRVLTTKTS
jgi:phosphoribosylaminoimidazolecarboxamide formyltransferase/IMP cyclohydrolase